MGHTYCTLVYLHTRTGQFFVGVWAVFAGKIFRQRPKKDCYMLTCKITLPGSPHIHPIILGQNPADIRQFISLDRMNLFDKYIFSFLADGFCPKIFLALCAKNNGFARRGGGCSPLAWLVRWFIWPRATCTWVGRSNEGSRAGYLSASEPGFYPATI